MNKLGLFDLTDELSVVEGRKKLVLVGLGEVLVVLGELLVGLGVVLPGVVLPNPSTVVSFASFTVVMLLNWAPIVGVGSVPIV